MKAFSWKIVICLVPILLAAGVVANAFAKYQAGEGGFNLGVDLVGGTILVYEVDQSRSPNGVMPNGYSVEKLAAKLKQRIDPADLYNVRITPLSDTRIEIVLPTGGRKYEEAQERRWQELLGQVKDKWPPKPDEEDAYNVGIGQKERLIAAVAAQHTDVDPATITDFINSLLPNRGEGRRSMTGEQVQRVKELISHVGSLKFVILANTNDDKDAIDVAKAYFDNVGSNPTELDKLRIAAVTGNPPPAPRPPDGKAFATELGAYNYSWIELGPEERHYYGLANDQQNTSTFWKEMEEARKSHKAILNTRSGGLYGTNLFYSRNVENPERLPERDRDKKYEYFILTRDPPVEDGVPQEITGEDLINEFPTEDQRKGQLAVGFTFNQQGSNRLAELTTKNKGRQMAIVLDDLIQSAPNILDPITGGSGIITMGNGPNQQEEVNRLVQILRSGALPATLKPQPVSEDTMGATLGADTIYWGTVSVIVAFVAILLFMLLYYRFAGIVACVALFANLLLTVALMVLINATFTLPGLAGLVLMLGMAVDANVLIYERLREERERGASLALAIRNGYDRAFPTIIDTHLSSIFTAIVLYVVGNDQLKGFGISLTLGLIISLFTSLFMTRLMFDLWLAKGWLKKLNFYSGLVRVLHARYWDFMSIRYYWFTATIVLTILGATVFFSRLDSGGLNIDFTGGTKYSGLLKPGDGMTIGQLRDALSDKVQREKLAVKDVQLLDEQGDYRVTYADGQVSDVFVNKDDGKLVPVEKVKERAESLPDVSVEQIYAQGFTEGDRSRLFTVRAQEMSPDLVQTSIGRLLAGKLEQTLMTDFTIGKDNKSADLRFTLFKLTPESLDKLRSAGVPEAVVNQLDTLKDKDFSTRQEFLAELAKVVPKEELDQYQGQVVKEANQSMFASPAQVQMLLTKQFKRTPGLEGLANQFSLEYPGQEKSGRYDDIRVVLTTSGSVDRAALEQALKAVQNEFRNRPQPESLENFDKALAADTQMRALYAILASWGAILLYLWFRFGSWTFGLAAVLCLIHDLFFTLGVIGIAHYIHLWWPNTIAHWLAIQDFKIDLNSVAALLTLVGYSVSDTIVVFDRIREVRGKNPELTPKMINDGVNQTLSRTILTALSVWLVVIVLYVLGGEGVHLFAFVMVVGVIVGTYSSIYIASPLLLIFGEGKTAGAQRQPVPQSVQG